MLATWGRFRAITGQTRLKLGRLVANLAELRPELVEVAPTLVEREQTWRKSGQLLSTPSRAEFGRHRAEFNPIRPNFGRIRRMDITQQLCPVFESALAHEPIRRHPNDALSSLAWIPQTDTRLEHDRAPHRPLSVPSAFSPFIAEL